MAQGATSQVTLSVSGMSCGGCAAGIERTLTRTPGVRAAQVRLAAEEATVEFDPALTSPQALAALGSLTPGVAVLLVR